MTPVAFRRRVISLGDRASGEEAGAVLIPLGVCTMREAAFFGDYYRRVTCAPDGTVTPTVPPGCHRLEGSPPLTGFMRASATTCDGLEGVDYVTCVVFVG